MIRPTPIPPQPGQESVWDYPRPARLEATSKHLLVIFNGVTLAETTRGMRILETSHPPTYYFPSADVHLDYLNLLDRKTFCEWKGQCTYYQVTVNGKTADHAAWRYPNPTPNFAAIKESYGFLASFMDACYVDGERVNPQPGDYYGGWITKDIVGPFKGGPGTMGW